MKAIIMAGGEGSRLRPLTCDRPKPMVPVANRPIMAYAVNLLKLHGIKDIGITLQYLPEVIKNYFGQGERYQVNFRYFVEEEPLGTAGSVKNAEDFLDDTFIVISGDALTDFDLAQALDFHRRQGAVATLVLTTVENPLQYGVVITEKDGRIRRFLEKPSWGEVFSDLVNTGIYILEPEVLQYIPNKQKFDFSKDLFPLLMSQKKQLFGCNLDGYWCDIGNLEQYLQAHYDILSNKVKIELQGEMTSLEDGVLVGKGTNIHDQARIQGPVLLGEDCEVTAGAVLQPFTVLGNKVCVDEGASVKRSVVWDGVYLGKRSEVRGAVLCRNISLQDGARIFESAAIGDGTVVGKNASVSPGVKIWPHKTIDSGLPLNYSLVWGSGLDKALFGPEGVGGKINVDLTPEFSVRLGLASATGLPRGACVAVSGDGTEATSLLKGAFISGLRAAGSKVYDLDDLYTPAHRSFVTQNHLELGVHFKRDVEDQDKVWILFSGPEGHDLDPGKSRKIENLFWMEDFRRMLPDDLPEIIRTHRVMETYLEKVLESVDAGRIRKKGYKLVLAYQNPVLSLVMSDFLEKKLECSLEEYQLSGHGEKLKSWSEISTMLPFLARKVVAHKADLGAVIDRNGENLILVDERGEILNTNLYLVLVALMIFKANDRGAVAVPVTVSRVVEKLAEDYGGEVIRTKTSRYAVMHAGDKVRARQGRYPQLSLQYDVFSALALLLDFLSERKTTLSQLVSEIPPVFVSEKNTSCPWEYKGKVMRTLIEKEPAYKVELIDGIKVHAEDGWVLTLPDSEDPCYQVYSEGYSQEAADELTGFYADKIDQIVKKS